MSKVGVACGVTVAVPCGDGEAAALDEANRITPRVNRMKRNGGSRRVMNGAVLSGEVEVLFPLNRDDFFGFHLGFDNVRHPTHDANLNLVSQAVVFEAGATTNQPYAFTFQGMQLF